MHKLGQFTFFTMKNVILNRTIAMNILRANLQRERKTFSKYACFSKNAYRFNIERIPDRINIRPPFFHDTDKIIHSLAYTRYIDKTQVFYLFENDHITHRVLHVQLVSKIARVIGRALSLNEDLIDAIALAHDLGHVPYGHNGERKLNELIFSIANEYFCHNAQSVRALEHIENKGKGLNISLQVQDGILCHNGELMLKEYHPDYRKTPEQFKDEYNRCWKIKDTSKEIISMTLEGCVVRIADVIAYIGRDLEDAITLNLINRNDIPRGVSETIGNTNASIINNFVLDIINNSYNTDSIRMSDKMHQAIDEFYKFSNEAIYQHPVKTSQDDKIAYMFEVLFNKYLNDLVADKRETSISNHFIKTMDKNYMTTNAPFRIVSDYIAGMTDDFFNNEFKNFLIPISFGYKAKA